MVPVRYNHPASFVEAIQAQTRLCHSAASDRPNPSRCLHAIAPRSAAGMRPANAARVAQRARRVRASRPRPARRAYVACVARLAGDMVHRVTPLSLPLRRLALGVVFVGAILLVVALDRGRPAELSGAAAPGFSLTNVAREVGIDFVHHAPRLDPKIDNIAPLVAAYGASVSVSDVNNDGWPDLYFTNSRFGFPNALYVNRGDGTFVDVAESAAVAALNLPGQGVSMGAVWGDYDNDGLEDLLVYKWGYLQLFKNMGNLHFKDVTEEAGLHHWLNSNGAGWFDYDRDGLRELYVTSDFRSDIDCLHLKTTRIMENSFEYAANGGGHRLFHNLGNGRFEDVTEKMGVGSTRWTFAVAAGDFIGDGWPDLFLANDYRPAALYVNDSGQRVRFARVAP